ACECRSAGDSDSLSLLEVFALAPIAPPKVLRPFLGRLPPRSERGWAGAPSPGRSDPVVSKNPRMRIRDLNWMQLEEYLARDDRVVFPVGSTEQYAFLRSRPTTSSRSVWRSRRPSLWACPCCRCSRTD